MGPELWFLEGDPDQPWAAWPSEANPWRVSPQEAPDSRLTVEVMLPSAYPFEVGTTVLEFAETLPDDLLQVDVIDPDGRLVTAENVWLADGLLRAVLE